MMNSKIVFSSVAFPVVESVRMQWLAKAGSSIKRGLNKAKGSIKKEVKAIKKDLFTNVDQPAPQEKELAINLFDHVVVKTLGGPKKFVTYLVESKKCPEESRVAFQATGKGRWCIHCSPNVNGPKLSTLKDFQELVSLVQEAKSDIQQAKLDIKQAKLDIKKASNERKKLLKTGKLVVNDAEHEAQELRIQALVLDIVRMIFLQKSQILQRKATMASEEKCLICYDSLNPSSKPSKFCKGCYKGYHEECLEKWVGISHKRECPHCKQEKDYEPLDPEMSLEDEQKRLEEKLSELKKLSPDAHKSLTSDGWKKISAETLEKHSQEFNQHIQTENFSVAHEVIVAMDKMFFSTHSLKDILFMKLLPHEDRPLEKLQKWKKNKSAPKVRDLMLKKLVKLSELSWLENDHLPTLMYLMEQKKQMS